MFEDFYGKCLQKSPKSRPSASELLKHKFLQKRSPDSLVSELLDRIDIVGASASKDAASNSVLDSIEELESLSLADCATVDRSRSAGMRSLR